MVKLLFDHQKFTTQRYGGISRYFANIIQYIDKDSEFESDLGVLYSQNHYINQNYSSLDQQFSKLLKKSWIARKLYQANEAYSSYLAQKGDYDIFHPTYYDPYFLGKIKKPMVTTIHDMTYEKLPEYFWAHDTLTKNKRLQVENADAIIAISETTKSDLLNIHKVDESKISVIYHGIDLNTPLEFAPVANLPGEYLLYVGDRSGYKNFYLFISAFSILAQKFPNLKLILTGGGPLGIVDQEILKRLHLNDKVSHINVTDGQLNTLYKRCSLFVYPSLYEGFGLPILEAFKAQCPILLSDTPCFKEIAGDSVLYFNPTQLDDLVSKIETILLSPSLKEQLLISGTAKLQSYPIETSIQKTLDLYKSMV
tara:strand:+ start:478 stop:1578 length:1101 start_codon:yes stop_codon:yes gene_type:complete